MLIVKNRANGTRRVQNKCVGTSIVEQSHKKACDINTIMAKVRRGESVPLTSRSPLYGDFTAAESLLDTHIQIQEAKKDFAGLSAEIRKRFHNNPWELMEFLECRENEQEAIDLGILERPVPPEPPKEIVPPDAPGGAQTESEDGSSG